MPTHLKLDVDVEHLAMKAPFRIANRTFESLPVVVAHLSRGEAIGRGEAAGVYYLDDNPEDMASTLRALAENLPSDLTRQSIQAILPSGGARNALDCAFWDLEAQEAGVRVSEMTGLDPLHPLVTTMTLGADTPERMASGALGFKDVKALKLKLTGETEIDIARVRAVRGCSPDVWIGVDANQGYTPASLAPLVPVLMDCRVELLEQPFARGREADMEGLNLPLPTAADESCQNLAELEMLVGRFDVVNIKLDKCGGLTEGLLMAARAKELGLGVMVGNMMGTSLATAPAFVLGQLCNIVDLDGAIFLSADRTPAVDYRGGNVWVPEEAWGGPRR